MDKGSAGVAVAAEAAAAPEAEAPAAPGGLFDVFEGEQSPTAAIKLFFFFFFFDKRKEKARTIKG